jgi:peptidoglycan/LPS O-acetylase OafA/YrhL
MISSSIAPPKHIPVLDGWRAFAILMLLWGHGTRGWIHLPFNSGFCAVNFFFVLSGFLITYRLLTDYSIDDQIQFRKFYIRRIFRILPPALLYLAVVSLLGLLRVIPVWPGEVFSALLFSRNYVGIPPGQPLGTGWFTGHFWSLAVEEHFYLLWPIALQLAKPKRAKWVAVGGIVLCAIWRYTAWNFGIGSLPGAPFYFRTDIRFDALLIGSLLGICYADSGVRNKLSQLIPQRDTVIIFGLYVWVLLRMFEPADLKELFLVAGLLAVTSLHPDSWVGIILQLAPIRWIGRISYSLYIWQQLFLTPGTRPLGFLNRTPVDIAATFCVAALSFYLVETPMIKLGYKLSKRLATSKPVCCVASAERRIS